MTLEASMYILSCSHVHTYVLQLYITTVRIITLETVMKTKEGRMAEWSKALVLGTSHFGGMGSNPTPVIADRFLSFLSSSQKFHQPT